MKDPFAEIVEHIKACQAQEESFESLDEMDKDILKLINLAKGITVRLKVIDELLPTPEVLRQLGLNDMARDIENIKVILKGIEGA